MTSLYQPITLILKFYNMSNGLTKFLPVLGSDLKMQPVQNFKEIGSESLINRRKTCATDLLK